MKRLWTVREIAEITGWSTHRVYRMAHRGELPTPKRLGNRWLFTSHSLLTHIPWIYEVLAAAEAEAEA